MIRKMPTVETVGIMQFELLSDGEVADRVLMVTLLQCLLNL
jgi:hypothetical protein